MFNIKSEKDRKAVHVVNYIRKLKSNNKLNDIDYKIHKVLNPDTKRFIGKIDDYNNYYIY